MKRIPIIFTLLWAAIGSPSTASREHIIHSGDVLFIQVISAAAKELDVNRDCRVGSSGEVDWLMFGRIKLAGHTCKSAAILLTERVSTVVREPHVVVHLLNKQEADRVTGSCERHAVNPGGDLRPLLAPIRVLVLKYYPNAKVVFANQTITLQYNARKFMIHEALKTGEWQDAHEVTGPNKGGVYGEIELRSGAWNGAAMSPQSFDKRYFVDRLMTPYSKRLDHHLYIHLSFPHNAPAAFLKDFESLVNDFGRHMIEDK